MRGTSENGQTWYTEQCARHAGDVTLAGNGVGFCAKSHRRATRNRRKQRGAIVGHAVALRTKIFDGYSIAYQGIDRSSRCGAACRCRKRATGQARHTAHRAEKIRIRDAGIGARLPYGYDVTRSRRCARR